MRILVLSAATGGGHLRAASAIKSYADKYCKEHEIEVVDAFEYIGYLYNKTVAGGYEFMAKHTPNLFGTVYNHTNKDTHLNNMATKFNKLHSKKLLPLIEEKKPDIIICVHPFAGEMVSDLKEKNKINIPAICIITDFAPHRMYIQDYLDAYVVSSNEMKESLIELGVKPDIIHTMGIPIDVSFYEDYNKIELLLEMGLAPNLKTLLIMAGSFGVTDILKIYQSVVETDAEFQIIVITGKNKKLYDKFEEMLSKKNKGLKTDTKNNKPTKLMFFVSDINKYMYVADLIVTKPGGLTVSEAIASSLPMAIFKAFPGQEEDNANYLERNNMAIRLPKGDKCGQVIKDLLCNEEKLNSMKEACKSKYHDLSAKQVYELAESLVNK